MDWAAVVRQEGERSSILRADRLAETLNLNPVVVTQALARQERRGLVEHISKKIYFNHLASAASTRDLVNVIRPESYISLETALREYGISTQSPSAITCVTTGRPGRFSGRSIRLTFRSISRLLYWGFSEKKTRYGQYKLADPEKALLDSVYFALQSGIEPPFDELELNSLSRRRLLEYSARFPNTVNNCIIKVLAARSIAP